MDKYEQSNGWYFEIVQIRARKVDVIGDAYKSVCNLTVTDGEVHIEGLLGEFTKKDKFALASFLKSMGFDCALASEYIDGVRKSKKLFG